MKRLRKDRIGPLLEELALQRRIYCPQLLPGGEVVYAEPGLGNLDLDNGKPLISAKAFLMPQVEAIAEFARQEISIITEAEPTLLFGIAPCEMRAIQFVERFMTRDGLSDPHFTSRRRAMIIIVVACKEPRDRFCFCIEANGKPFAESGYDLQMFDLGDFYLVESGSANGDALLSLGLFEEAGPEDARLLEEEKSRTAKIAQINPGMAGALRVLAKENVDEEFWENLAACCLNCGSCVYVCPTCTCYYVTDLTSVKGYTRLRGWDACLHEGFSRETSGHNPRPTPGTRLARRHEHKLKFDVMNFGGSACVGCGRCSLVCPVGLGAIEIISKLNWSFGSIDEGKSDFDIFKKRGKEGWE